MRANSSNPLPGVEGLPLIGREREQELLGGLIEHAREGRSGVLVIRGEAGIGKTALLEDALTRAEGMTLLYASGIESESELPFAGLSQLLRPLLGRLDELPPPQAAALAGALALGPPVPGDPFTTSVATLSLLAAGADESGLVAAVDDAQFVDAASLQALTFAARRLRAEGVVLLFAARTGHPSRLDTAGLHELELRGLDVAAARELLGRVAPRLAREAGDRVLETAAGNPLALVELPAGLTPEEAAGDLTRFEPLRTTAAIEGAFRREFERLSPGERRALVLAAAADANEGDVISRALGAVDASWADLESAEAAGLVSLGPVVSFRHPLLRSTAYHAATAPERRKAHRALADADPDGPAQAWHRALACDGPDEAVASALAEAGTNAFLRGAPGSAGRALELAVALTPESPARAQRMYSAAESLVLAGRTERAFEILAGTLRSTDDPALRASVQLLRARALIYVGSPLEAHATLAAEAQRLGESDPAQASRLYCEACVTMMAAGRPAQVLESAQEAYRLAEPLGAGALVVPTIVLSMGLILVGEASQGAELLDRGMAGMTNAPPDVTAPLLPGAAAFLAVLGREDASRAVLAQGIATFRSMTAPGLLVYPLATLGLVDFRLGRWTSGYAAATEALELADQTGLALLRWWALIALAKIEAGRGQAAECRAHATDALEGARATGAENHTLYARSALVLNALGEGATQEAIAHGEPLALLWGERGYKEPGVANWHADLIEAYVHAGEEGKAESLLASFAEQAAATGEASALAGVARCRGLLAGEAEFEDEFATALAHHQRTPTPFERARTQLSLGERRRRAKRRADAREPLRSALAIFEELGAVPWADRARAELRACGETRTKPSPGPLEELTPHELQVALVVARGATNREAASELFLSPKTIDFHLRNVYRKLGLRSRAELARMLALEPSDTTADGHTPAAHERL